LTPIFSSRPSWFSPFLATLAELRKQTNIQWCAACHPRRVGSIGGRLWIDAIAAVGIFLPWFPGKFFLRCGPRFAQAIVKQGILNGGTVVAERSACECQLILSRRGLGCQ
jgi:hypothetical protein